MKLNEEYSARLLSSKASMLGISIETYAVHPTDNPGASVAQIELFKGPTHRTWTFWSGSHWRALPRRLGVALEAVRNAR